MGPQTFRPAAAIAFAVCMFLPLAAAAMESYGDCANDADPPGCIAARVATHYSSTSPSESVRAVLGGGLVDIAADHPVMIADGAFATLSGPFPRLFVAELADGSTRDKLSDHGLRVLTAGVVLLAAALREDDPFQNPSVRAWMARAGSDTSVAAVSVGLWWEMQLGGDLWRTGSLVLPRGMASVWDAVIASPPRNTELVAELGNIAWWSGFESKSLPLLEIAASRSDTSPDVKAAMASELARLHNRADIAERLMSDGGDNAPNYDVAVIRREIAVAHLAHGRDEADVRIVETAATAATARDAIYFEAKLIQALARAGAHEALVRIGQHYLEHARDPRLGMYERSNWYEHASDAYLFAGAREKAVAAAREGLPTVDPAVQTRSFSGAAARTQEDRVRATVGVSGFGTGPVRALYRAGERDEAIATGYLWGYDHFRYAPIAGETPDPMWVVADHNGFEVKLVVSDLMADPNNALAKRLDDGLGRCARLSDDPEQNEMYGLTAALAGRQSEVTDCFTRSLRALDRDPNAESRAYFALRLAARWRMGQLILTRINPSQRP